MIIDFPKNIVVYTCIIGNYDTLREVKNPEENVDYICFTDSDLISETWEIKKIENSLNLDNTRFSRYPKIMPHLFLKDYEISVWVDGSITVIGNVTKFIKENLHTNVCMCKHPHRNCIYDEGKVIRHGIDVPEAVDKQMKKYKSENFPAKNGLIAGGLMIRKHNSKECIEINKQWWGEIINNSKRDQLSFNYVAWKNPNFKYDIIPFDTMKSEYFLIGAH